MAATSKKLIDRGEHVAYGMESRLNVESRIMREEVISLFEPAYPNQNALHTIVTKATKG